MRTQLPYGARSQVYDIVSAIENLKPSLKRLEGIDMSVIKKETGLSLISASGFGVKNKNAEITFSTDDIYSFHIQEKTNNNTTDIFVKNNFIEESNGLNSEPNAIEKFLSKVCELLDFPLLKLRKLLSGNKLEILLEQLSATKQSIPAGQLSSSRMELAKEIESLFRETEDILKTVEISSSRSYIKKSYPNTKDGTQLNKRIEFAGIGKNGEDYSLQVINDHRSKTNIVIRITDKNHNKQNIIIEPDGKVLKYKNITWKCNLGNRSVYYPQEFLDSPEIQEHMEILKNEMEKYKAYLSERVVKRKNFIAKNTTDSIGELNENSLKTIKRIHKNYDKLRSTITKIKVPFRKELAKEKLGIETVTGDPTIIFKDKETIRLSFPPLKGKESVKILVLDENENITKSYCIQDSNLIKFNPTNVSRGKLSHTKNNYHSQEEIDSSGIDEYLKKLDKRLKNIMKIIKSGAGWYLN